MRKEKEKWFVFFTIIISYYILSKTTVLFGYCYDEKFTKRRLTVIYYYYCNNNINNNIYKLYRIRNL